LHQEFCNLVISPKFNSRGWFVSFTDRLLALPYEKGIIYHRYLVRMHSNKLINLAMQNVGMAGSFILNVIFRFM